MIEHDIQDYLNGTTPFDKRKKILGLLKDAQGEIEMLRKSEAAIKQLESLKYFDDWIKLADSWDESPETDFKVFLSNFMESNDPESPTQVIF